MPTWHIPLNVPTCQTDIFDVPIMVRAFLTSNSIRSRYHVPVLDVGADTDYVAADYVPIYGKTAAAIVLSALAFTELDNPIDDGHPDDQLAAEAHWRRGIELFFRSWPDGPQVIWD